MNFRIVLKKRLESINVDWIESNEFSIIAEKFGHREIQEILLTSNDLINATKKYRRANDQDDPRELKRSYISEIKDKEFKSFFLTKIMSL
ncbi:unnamed protein product [Rhizophagus irregularis]|uniref:Uncharacterized protein n=1 Tax=Rhizophagus irregularis TaxID=588596 RepID=A0A916EI11_9GLOM|nr:unnamed protein product [Rhizophagus irregularis]CAB4493086.1 unnamed protein product [Rhizophagus irregularis]CAB5357084.1 unnamed protein product [Rhizophagus irregularis]CAB5392770.1 unnamed protein product [Rhizophagus irregularis]